MEIEEHRITVREVCRGYYNDDEEGVVGYDERLDIRPKYQREFIYKDRQRDEVIHTIQKGLPLNVMYWVKTGDNAYEVLDGQQRTVSVCEYVEGNYSIEGMYFGNLPKDKQDQILDYELFVYICDGTDSEKLEWFKIVNIAGERLTDQELRNAVYSGPWVSDAKRYFSKTSGPAYNLAGRYLKGEAIRQDYLETAIRWHASGYDITIEEYMARHQQDPTAQPLWSYFRSVIEWVESLFPKYRIEMKGIEWGLLYNENKDRTDLDPAALEDEVARLMEDEDVTSKKGIYEYLFDDNENHLNIRTFDKRTKREMYEAQHGRCAICGKEFPLQKMHADHIRPWSEGGRTDKDNCQLLCIECNLAKGAR